MNDKRDAETDLLIDIQKIIGADHPSDAVTVVRYIEFREAELRREIAVDLTVIHPPYSHGQDSDINCDICKYIENFEVTNEKRNR